MSQQSSRPVRSFSPVEERLFAKAETAIESLGLKYQASVQYQFLQICGHVAEKRWQDASNIAHSICGEAGSFQRPAMAEVAVLLRDILDVSDPESLKPAIRVFQDGLSLLISSDAEANSETADDLLKGLRAVAIKSGLEVSP